MDLDSFRLAWFLLTKSEENTKWGILKQNYNEMYWCLVIASVSAVRWTLFEYLIIYQHGDDECEEKDKDKHKLHSLAIFAWPISITLSLIYWVTIKIFIHGRPVVDKCTYHI